MDLEEELNILTNNKYGFKLKTAVLLQSKNQCNIELFYNDGTILDLEDKNTINKTIKEFLPADYCYNIKFIKNFITCETILDFVFNYIKNCYASLTFKINKVIDTSGIVISLSIAEIQKEYVISKQIINKINKAVFDRFGIQSNIDVVYDKNLVLTSENIVKEVIISEPTSKKIVVTNKEILVGELIEGDAGYIRDSKIVSSIATVCGIVKNVREYFTKPKAAEGEDQEALNEKFKDPNITAQERIAAGCKPYYKFKLVDFTDEILVVLFPSKHFYNASKSIVDGIALTVEGAVVEDDFNGVSIKAKNINSCTLPDVWEEKIEYKTEKANYEYVEPEDMIYSNQVGLFSLNQEEQVEAFLKNNDIVVFDLETTGLNVYAGDKMVEIGAVKLKNGAIVQKFRTLVNPKMPIPKESTKVHHITDQDVANAPTAEQVLPDFYKFTRGCVLVGYNVSFDYGFLTKQGKDCGYNFDNKTYDCYKVAQKVIKGVKNYKLVTIAKHLNILLDNAHSAFYDTLATAELLIKLAPHMEQYN